MLSNRIAGIHNYIPSKMRISLIVAGCRVEDPKQLGIGLNGDLPWKLSQEMKHFTKLTKSGGAGKNAVLMGRKTWESIPSKFRPLRDRYVLLTFVARSENPGGGGLVVLWWA
jgi:dihydrofolate reductase